MFRAIVVGLILTIALRVILSTYSAFMEGLRGGGDVRGRRPSSAPPQPVHMVRDPVCGIFVVPERAVSIADGRGRIHFCSERCRDAYRARTA